MLHPPIHPPPTLQPGGDLQLLHAQLIVPRTAILGCSITSVLAYQMQQLVQISVGGSRSSNTNTKGYIVVADRRQRRNAAGRQLLQPKTLARAT